MYVKSAQIYMHIYLNLGRLLDQWCLSLCYQGLTVYGLADDRGKYLGEWVSEWDDNWQSGC